MPAFFGTAFHHIPNDVWGNSSLLSKPILQNPPEYPAFSDP